MSEEKQIIRETLVLQQQRMMLEKELERMILALGDLSVALSTMKKIKDEEAFVPIGGNNFLKGRIMSTNALVSIGGGYHTELKKEDAIEEIKKRMESIKKTTDRINEEIKKIDEKAERLRKKLKEYPVGEEQQYV